jgi:type IV secretion system protein VirB11
VNALARSLTVFIDGALDPVRPWLEDDQVVEICANGPGEVWVERFGQSAMERHEVPSLTEHAIRHLAERVAGHSARASMRSTRCSRPRCRQGSGFRA